MSGTSSPHTGLTRRSFLKTTGATAGIAACSGLLGGGLAVASSLDDNSRAGENEEIFSVMCRSNCMGSCRWLAHVKDGKLVKLEPGDYPNEGYRGGCLKGSAYIERVYSPTRIKQPLRRVAGSERGAGEWEAISWDEAMTEAAEKIKAAADQFGPKSIIFDCASGQYGYFNGVYNQFARLAGVMGATKTAVCYDYAAGYGINRVLGTGDWAYCNEPNSVLDSSLVVVWGTNPVFTAPQNWRWIQWAKERGTRVITIDPIKSATAHRSDEWICVKPGYDGYLALAMANYLIENDLQNTDYIMSESTGPFLVREDTKAHLRTSNWPAESAAAYASAVGAAKEAAKASGAAAMAAAAAAVPNKYYVWDADVNAPVLVEEAANPVLEGTFTTPDGVKVTTAFSLLKEQLTQYSIAEASRLTGVPEDRIVSLAKEFATERAVSVNITYGLDHYVNGYLNTWAVAILLALCGQFERDGAGFTGVFTQTYTPALTTYWFNTPEFKEYNTNVPNVRLPEMFETQKLEGKDYPAKVLVSYCHNPMSNMVGQNEWISKVLPNVEYWIVLDMEMNDSCRYCDLILPVASWYEKEDLRTAYNNPYMTLSEKAIEPLHDTKSDLEIIGMLGRALGYEASFPEDTWNDTSLWLKLLFSDKVSQDAGYSEERLRKEKVINYTGQEEGKPWIRGKSAPWPTQSGRVQLYYEAVAPRLSYGQDLADRDPDEHIVYFREPDECGIDSPMAEKYPLVYLQEHSRFRVHTQWYETPVLRELDPEPLGKVNGADAEARGVANGDYIEVFNDRGFAVVKCLIDESIAPGIVSIPKGWQRDQFKAGCYQEMTNPKTDKYSDSIAPYDTRVDFKKWEG
ncbi:hypothetical protein B5F40_05100 [Gordonibacter sp. An230]|uniref:molybdopterin-containing oxidoreductase family protein n=1 Tax=Gordonibacter sp. An230 TaxID=1965592 RepID=UPI000B3715A1|nr:molybdopterin-dependent oxidoreductase [Gordonibacter sp. An230]OUO90844.1 hypothetical protein B5F40_05100 [Gordonibacter sp. An230]